VAHELFHDWLGIRLHESHGSLVWFREGFTEYFSQWFTAATGSISRATFADTLEEYDRFAREPQGTFHFHRGPEYACRMLGYAPQELATMPEESTATFAGVGNPHRIGPIAPGET